MHLWVRARLTVTLALIYRASVGEKAREWTSLMGAKKDPEKFGPLKAVLADISALYADREVCLQSIYSNSPLMNTFLGIHRRGKQGCKPPPANSRVGRTLRFAPTVG